MQTLTLIVGIILAFVLIYSCYLLKTALVFKKVTQEILDKNPDIFDLLDRWNAQNKA